MNLGRRLRKNGSVGNRTSPVQSRCLCRLDKILQVQKHSQQVRLIRRCLFYRIGEASRPQHRSCRSRASSASLASREVELEVLSSMRMRKSIDDADSRSDDVHDITINRSRTLTAARGTRRRRSAHSLSWQQTVLGLQSLMGLFVPRAHTQHRTLLQLGRSRMFTCTIIAVPTPRPVG